MNADPTAIATGGTALSQGTRLADFSWKLDHSSWLERQLLLVGTAQEPSLPIQLKRGFGEAIAIADRPGFTVNL
jgi:hypothetical protein